MKSSKISIKTRSTPASLSFKGQATKHTTVKWSILCPGGPEVIIATYPCLNHNLRPAISAISDPHLGCLEEIGSSLELPQPVFVF